MAITFVCLLCFSNNPNALLYIVWILESDVKQYGINILVVIQLQLNCNSNSCNIILTKLQISLNLIRPRPKPILYLA